MADRDHIHRPVTRRAVLLGGAATLGTVAIGGAGAANPALARAAATRGAGRARPLGPYFNLGVASGDPVPDGVVLWTRLAPEPTAEDGLGGMPDTSVEVEWELAEDEAFSRIVQRGTADATSDFAHSVHVEVSGLNAGAEYFYRFRAEGELSGVGRTRTAPAPGTMGELTMCFASCAQYEHGYFAAYRRMAEDEPGLILHLGDYLYEREAGGYPLPDDAPLVREHVGPEIVSLANYRQRYGQYKTDLDLQAAHAVAPWAVVFDDHELENNWADEHPEESSDTQGQEYLDRRAAAFRAYWENMPLRSNARPSGIDMQLYRRLVWGGLATFHLLDTRQYRSDQVCGEEPVCDDRNDPARSITGDAQEQWLTDGLNGSTARWDVLGQQVFFAKRDTDTDSGEEYSMDQWDGYTASRDRVTAAIAGSQALRNGVILTGDVHRHYAAEIKRDFTDPDSESVAVELVATSITSTGDGDADAENAAVLEENPHLKFYKNLRGYVRTTFTATELRADFRTLPNVSEPDAAAETAQSFVVADGNPALEPAARR